MYTIETIGTIAQDGKLTLDVPADLAPGKHRVVVVIEEQPIAASAAPPALELPVFDVGPWPENLSVRREDIYGDEGR